MQLGPNVMSDVRARVYVYVQIVLHGIQTPVSNMFLCLFLRFNANKQQKLNVREKNEREKRASANVANDLKH